MVFTCVVQAIVRAAWTCLRNHDGNLDCGQSMSVVAELFGVVDGTYHGWSSISNKCIRGRKGAIVSCVLTTCKG